MRVWTNSRNSWREYVPEGAIVAAGFSLTSVPGSAWDRTAVEALPLLVAGNRNHAWAGSAGRACKAVRSQAEPGTEYGARFIIEPSAIRGGSVLAEMIFMLFSFAALILPIAVYCLVLAMINRRVNPLMISGAWDSIGLILACSGGLLVCGPSIIYVNFSRNGVFQEIEQDEERNPNEPPPKDADKEDAQQTEPSRFMVWWWVVYWGYFIVVLAGSALLVLFRRDKTFIYNCDPDLLDEVLARVLDKCSLNHVRVGRKIFIGSREMMVTQPALPVTPGPETVKPDLSKIVTSNSSTNIRAGAPHSQGSRKLGEVNIVPFPAMCHVTLQWSTVAPSLREEIEDELRRNLDECRCLDNPAAGWFLSIGAILFFISLAVIVFILLVLFFPRR